MLLLLLLLWILVYFIRLLDDFFVLCCVVLLCQLYYCTVYCDDGLIADRSIFAAAAAEVSQTENNPQGIGLMFAT
jgi:hypothetical protein